MTGVVGESSQSSFCFLTCKKMKYFFFVTSLAVFAFQMPNGNDMMLIERLSNSMGARVRYEKS